jgi:hypothetical protein
VVDKTRPPGTGLYKFQLLTLFENQRKRSGRFSDRALTAADPPPVSDARGGISPERWTTAGMLGATRFCAWRSTWKRSGGWAYAPSFSTPRDAWTADEVAASSEVRRRQLVQVLQLEVVDPDAVAQRDAEESAATTAATTAWDAYDASSDADGAVPSMPRPVAVTATLSPAGKPSSTSSNKVPEPLEWAWTDMELQVDIETLHHAIFKQNSELLSAMNEMRKVTNFEGTPWVGEGTNQQREVCVVLCVCVSGSAFRVRTTVLA